MKTKTSRAREKDRFVRPHTSSVSSSEGSSGGDMFSNNVRPRAATGDVNNSGSEWDSDKDDVVIMRPRGFSAADNNSTTNDANGNRLKFCCRLLQHCKVLILKYFIHSSLITIYFRFWEVVYAGLSPDLQKFFEMEDAAAVRPSIVKQHQYNNDLDANDNNNYNNANECKTDESKYRSSHLSRESNASTSTTKNINFHSESTFVDEESLLNTPLAALMPPGAVKTHSTAPDSFNSNSTGNNNGHSKSSSSELKNIFFRDVNSALNALESIVLEHLSVKSVADLDLWYLSIF